MHNSRWMVVFAFLAVLSPFAAMAEGLQLQEGDHICIIGNTLAERMQHDGWLEALHHGRFPRHALTIRNLGFSGDELTLRLRSQDFGTPDQWLARCQADVVYAFFGYNESYGGEAGLPKFKKDLENYLKHLRGQKYNGKSAPRVVVFSPIAHEDLKNPHLPDGKQNNARLERYTKAMADVAAAQGATFVDLFTLTQRHYASNRGPMLTINGIHLSEQGNLWLARAIDQALFGGEATLDANALEKIRQAVLDKNFHWYNRYRTTDGYSIFGGRADLRFVDNQSNRDVMQRELEILDVMTANRDKRIWAVAQGGDLKIDDGNTPDFIPVKTNKPGPLPGGLHQFLGGEAAIEKMTVHSGMKVSLFASEKEFPDLINPVQMAFDTKGRLWVAVWPSYPHWKPKDPMNDKLLILEDTDGDGKADKCRVFADKLHNPTGFEFWGGGVLLAQAPDLMFLRDTDGDDVCDERHRILHGLDTADTHHTINSFVLDPGGALYMQEGTFHHTQVESPWGPPERCANGGVFRFEPRTFKFEVYVTYGFANPHGHVFDRWGQDIIHDGTGAEPYHGTVFSGRLDFPKKHSGAPKIYERRTRPCPGTEILSSQHFPDEMQGNLLVANVIGFQGILRYRIQDKASTFSGTEAEPIVFSSDPNFRPSDLEVGPDGALWFTDWQNPIIGHMQHNLRDPSRDKLHGRVYRVTCNDRPLSRPPKIAGESVASLLDLLKHPEDRVRYRARIELSARNTAEVTSALEKWMPALDKSDKDHEHHMLEALWLYQNHNVVNEDLLRRMLRSTDFRARAAATRVLCYWRDRVREPLALLKAQVEDEHPRVRLEAVRACSYFRDPQAIETALLVVTLPMDDALQYTLNETLKQLESLGKK